MTRRDSQGEENEDIIEISAEDLEPELAEEAGLGGDAVLVIDREGLPEVEQRAPMPADYPPVTGVGHERHLGKKPLAGGLLSSAVLQMAVAGLVGGFFAWAVSEPFISDEPTRETLVTALLAMGGFGAALGGIIGLALGSVEGIVTGVWEKAVTGGGLGLAIGGAGGAAGGAIGQLAYSSFDGGDPTLGASALVVQVVARAMAWSLVGLFIGLGQGAATRATRKIVNGLAGGAIGGFLGGLLFDPISLVFGGVSLALTGQVSGWLSRLVGMSVLGLCTGAAIGMVEEIRKGAWLTIVGGPLTGKQFIIYRSPTIIGSSPKADICLVKDAQVAAQHARIERQGNRYTLVDMSGGLTAVNDRPTARRQLRDGDLIVVGKTVLEYQARLSPPPTGSLGPIGS